MAPHGPPMSGGAPNVDWSHDARRRASWGPPAFGAPAAMCGPWAATHHGSNRRLAPHRSCAVRAAPRTSRPIDVCRLTRHVRSVRRHAPRRRSPFGAPPDTCGPCAATHLADDRRLSRKPSISPFPRQASARRPDAWRRTRQHHHSRAEHPRRPTCVAPRRGPCRFRGPPRTTFRPAPLRPILHGSSGPPVPRRSDNRNPI